MRARPFFLHLALLLTAAAWLAALLLFRHHPALLGTALLAYGFGLRHGFDADHIAAIDNVTRRLMRVRDPAGIGFYFALGHSVVVTIAAAVVALTGSAVSRYLGLMQAVGGVAGSIVSALFLLALAAINTALLLPVWRDYRAARGASAISAEAAPPAQGALARLLRPGFRLVTRSPQMVVVGVLFGLGFDTATEIALLAISASQAQAGLPVGAIMVFPALFAAGMTLIDELDAMMMAGAYRRALSEPRRMLGYNLAITSASITVALMIAGAELLGLAGETGARDGLLRRAAGWLNAHDTLAGASVAGVFALFWLAALGLGRRPLAAADSGLP